MSIFNKINITGSNFSLTASIFLHLLVVAIIFWPESGENFGGGGGGNIEIDLGGLGNPGSSLSEEMPANDPVATEEKTTTNEEEKITETGKTEKVTTPEVKQTGSSTNVKSNSTTNTNTNTTTKNNNNTNTPGGNSGSSNNKGSSGTKGSGGGLYNGYSYGMGDTSSLTNVYREKTLNVAINYPKGWTFIDQNVKNKLDGVTFWLASGDIKPPPYVHLDVQDKNIFDARRFAFKETGRNCDIYFNDPEEMSGQVAQTFYLRTNQNEDYSIKLIVKGRGEFKAFQITFFGMLKTFKFGNRIF